MKTTITSASVLLMAAIILSGCGQSKPDSGAADQKSATPPSSPASAAMQAATEKPSAPPAAAAPASVAPATAAATSATPAPQSASPAPSSAAPSAPAEASTAQTTSPAASTAPASAATDAATQLMATAKAQGDTVLTSISADLASKSKTLVDSAPGNDALKSQLNSSLKSLASGNDSGGLTTLYQAAQSASLTPSQIQVAKEVGNLASAYVVQKNFASLDGAQGDVATIVKSLRQGQITPAIPAIQKVAQNASLTPTQKQLVASIADQYAPGISKAAGALTQGLQSIPGLGGSSK